MAATEQPVQETVAAKQEFAVENPATGEVIAHCPDLGPSDVAGDGQARPRGAARLGGARLRGPRADPARACRSG